MKDEIIRLLTLGNEVESIAEDLSDEKCMAEEFNEVYPAHCCEDASCYDCWKDKIVQIENEM